MYDNLSVKFAATYTESDGNNISYEIKSQSVTKENPEEGKVVEKDGENE